MNRHQTPPSPFPFTLDVWVLIYLAWCVRWIVTQSTQWHLYEYCPWWTSTWTSISEFNNGCSLAFLRIHGCRVCPLWLCGSGRREKMAVSFLPKAPTILQFIFPQAVHVSQMSVVESVAWRNWKQGDVEERPGNSEESLPASQDIVEWAWV